MEYGYLDHLFWYCFNDFGVNFLLMKSCTLHRIAVSQGTSNENINCSRLELKQPFKVISAEPGHTLIPGRWTLDSGLSNLDAGHYTLDTGLWALDTIVDCFRAKSETNF